MEQSEVSKKLAAAIDRFDEALDRFANSFNKRVLPQVEATIKAFEKFHERIKDCDI